MGYGTVDGGSAPAAGDLVVWMVFGGDNTAQPIVDLTGSGWAQARTYIGTAWGASILGKVLVAGDISGPPTVVSAPNTFGGSASWVAYTVSGTIATLTANALTLNIGSGGGANAPADIVIDSSALSSPDVAVTGCFGHSNGAGNTQTWTGATPDVDVEFQTYVGAPTRDRYMFGEDIGGVNITFHKDDNGGGNSNAAGYIAVDF